MRFFCGKNRGAISVFLTLILVPMLIFCGIVVDASRLFAAKTIISGAGDLAMNAALSRYDKKLKDGYGLLAMASSPESEEITSELEKYFMESCNAASFESGNDEKIHSMVQIELGNGGIRAKGVENSSLADTQVLQQQILEYMKYLAPVYMVTDILEKFQKLPLKNMEEKRDYVKKKSEYGKELSKLGKPLKEAKEYIEEHIAAVGGVGGFAEADIGEALAHYQEQSVFWLAARSLENYLDNVSIAPMSSDPITTERVQNNLSWSCIWDSGNTVFDDATYANMIAAVSIYQLRDSLASYMTEEYGFSQEDIEAFWSVGEKIQESIRNMDTIHDNAAEEYISIVESYEIEADNIIESAKQGIQALEEVIKIWEKDILPVKRECEEKKNKLLGKGEDLEGIEEQEKENAIQIDTMEVQSLISCLKNNQEAAEQFKKQIGKIKDVTKNLKKQRVTGEEGEWLLEYGSNHQDVIEYYWEQHKNNLGFPDSISCTFLDAEQEVFYQKVLKEIQEGSEDPEAKKIKDDSKREAESAQDDYERLLSGLESLENERNLKNFERITYPDEFPSGIEKIPGDINASHNVEKIDTSDDNISKITETEGFNSGMGKLLDGLDKISGELLERAYLMEYMTEMFNCLTTKADEKSLSGESLQDHYISNGEMEYLLYGNSNTLVNKTNSISVLFGLRLAINSIYVFLDSEKNMIADEIACGLSATTGQAWLYPIVKYGYLFCCAVKISGEDIVKLTKGEDVPVWHGSGDNNITLNYKEYMKLFVLITSMSEKGETKLLARVGDCIQFNTQEKLCNKYTMLTLQADVKVSTSFFPRVPAFLGKSTEESDGKKVIHYKSILAY
ncbi:MAG: DUF5702 domain-containing protein [Oliverpabstia sp.]